jgi:hypothetical protein
MALLTPNAGSTVPSHRADRNSAEISRAVRLARDRTAGAAPIAAEADQQAALQVRALLKWCETPAGF